ncbi:MAG: hypothetical protein K8R99_15325 [Actinomycetia bacterium]|nr:hypothetical protein [Actinomycetes bacterium]
MHAQFAPRFTRAQQLLIAILVLLFVGSAGFITWRVVSRDDSTSSGSVELAQHVVSLTETSLTIASADGTPTATAALPTGFDAMVVADQGRWLLEDNRDTAVNYFDLAATQPELRTVELPFPGFAIHSRTVRVGNDVVLLYSPDGLLGLAVVNLVDGTAYPIASAREKYYEAGSVRDFLLFKQVDGLNTVIVPVADPTAFWIMKGAVVDIRGTTTLIATVDGLANYVTVYDGLKVVGLRVQVENPIMGGMLTDTGAVVLEKTGGITVVDNLTGKVKRAGVSEFGAQGAIPVADNRLYGWGGEGSSILDEAGLPLAQATYALGTTAAGEQRPLVATDGGLGCLVLQPGPQRVAAGAGGLLVSVVDGTELLQLAASPSWVSSDGCTLVGLDASVVVDGRVVDVGLDQVFFVSPDRRSVLGRTASGDGTAQFVLLDLATNQTTELQSGFHLFAMF